MAGPELQAELIERCVDAQQGVKRLLVAFSGGMDSRVLLHLCVQSKRSPELTLEAVHINHGLQAESDDWAQTCVEICRDYGLKCHVLNASIALKNGDSVEAEARKHRYACFQSLAVTGDLILLAQHQDDQAETLLLQLLRGAGPEGLAAMPAKRFLGSAVLARPLLDVTRADIYTYARANKLQWIEDPSNRNDRFSRNYLRNSVLPILEKRFPAYRETLARTASHCAEASELIQTYSEELLATCGEGNTMILSQLSQLQTIQQKVVLRRWIASHGFLSPQTYQLDTLIQVFCAENPDALAALTLQGYAIRRYRDRLYLLVDKENARHAFSHSWDRLDTDLRIPELGVVLSRQYVEDHGVCLPESSAYVVCSRRGGDKILQGDPPRHKSVAKLFQEHAIPPWSRDNYIYIYQADRLISVLGLAVDPAYTGSLALRSNQKPN